MTAPRYGGVTTIDDPAVICPGKKYIFDLRKYEWKCIDTLIRVLTPLKKLGHGGMRVCYDVEEVDEEGRGTFMVAKMFKRSIMNVVEVDYFNEGAAQCMCEEFAENFNRIHVTTVRKPNISFLQCYVVRISANDIPQHCRHMPRGFFSYKTEDTHELMFVMEPKLTGTFTKYNSNYGEVYMEDKDADLTLTQKNRRSHIFEAAEAFSHFTLVESGGSMLVCDLQGVNDLLTDPQIHTEDGKGLGMGNMGQEGIDKFVSKHKCNDICAALHLKSLKSAHPAQECNRHVNHYVELRANLQRQNSVRPQDLVPLLKPIEEMSEDERVAYAIRLSQLTS